jgi:Cu(I)/Ag(I) efflux system membrane protein CusA/SilA
MKRIAAPMVGGLLSATVLTLFIIPSVWVTYRSLGLRRLRSARVMQKEDA